MSRRRRGRCRSTKRGAKGTRTPNPLLANSVRWPHEGPPSRGKRRLPPGDSPCSRPRCSTSLQYFRTIRGMARRFGSMAGRWVATTAGAHLAGRRKESTSPEAELRRAVHAVGGRFRLHPQIAKGCTPDFGLPARRIACSSTAASGTAAPSTAAKPPGLAQTQSSENSRGEIARPGGPGIAMNRWSWRPQGARMTQSRHSKPSAECTFTLDLSRSRCPPRQPS
jgi:hypothetical protein